MRIVDAATLAVMSLLSAQAFAWGWETRVDDMTGKPVRVAEAASQNRLDLGWPYGVVSGRLQVRVHPRYGRDVFVAVDKGQMLCHRSDDCPVLVRFDDRAPLRFSGNPPADHSSNVIFIENFDRFVGALRKAKTARIEIQFFQQGAHALVFDVSDFPDEILQPPGPRRKKN